MTTAPRDLIHSSSGRAIRPTFSGVRAGRSRAGGPGAGARRGLERGGARRAGRRIISGFPIPPTSRNPGVCMKRLDITWGCLVAGLILGGLAASGRCLAASGLSPSAAAGDAAPDSAITLPASCALEPFLAAHREAIGKELSRKKGFRGDDKSPAHE